MISEKLETPDDHLRASVKNFSIDQNTKGTLEENDIDNFTTLYIISKT